MESSSKLSEQLSSLAHHVNEHTAFEAGNTKFNNSHKKRFPSVLKIKGSVIPCKPCELFGLDIEKLENEELFKHRSYRRLYNIVANDQTSSNQVFRPNLIKELFFMLQITPFIEQSLRSGFLSRIEEWYNSNDYKKIKLAKSLDGFVKNVLKKEEESRPQTAINSRVQTAKTIKRPKSGVQWDSSLNPFLRPYTAKIRRNNSQQLTKFRPESSKFGVVSTNAETNLDFEENLEIEDEEQIDDIEEEWERSEDFKNKYRTLHPEEEPTYEKLMSLISKVSLPLGNTENSESSPEFLKAGPGFKRSTPQGNKRAIQSAAAKLTRETNNAKTLAEKELKESGSFEGFNDLKENVEKNGNEEDDEEIIEEDEQSEEDAISENENNKYGKFKSDKRTRQGRKLQNQNNVNHIYSTVNGVKILRPYTAQESNIINKLDQYSSLERNKRVLQSIDDQECLSQFKDYIRSKTKMKKEIVRKSEAKRYMDNFTKSVKIVPFKSSVINSPTDTHKTIENKTNEIINEKGNELLNKNDAVLPEMIEYKQNESDATNLKNNNWIELSSPFGYESEENCKYPTYNDRTYFETIKKKELSNQYRGISNFEVEAHRQDDKTISKMTNPQRLFLEEKFDPFHVSNINNYNKEALEEIEKIKEKFGGKITATTDALLKALYISNPYPNDEKENMRNEKGKVFEIPDKRYLMMKSDENKKKKRKMKYKKGSSKSKMSK